MRLAILGATSQIARDLVLSLGKGVNHDLVLYARRPDAVQQWLTNSDMSNRHAVADFGSFKTHESFDAILNFVGVGDPAQAAAMGASIFDVTLQYDDLVLNHLRHHPHCRHIFMSSGAAYGSNFDKPVDENTKATFAINDLKPQDWYGAAKFHAECRHRSLTQLPIVDVRVFNYFSCTQDVSARFLMMDIMRAIRDNTVLMTSPDYIVRDFIHPSDFCRLITSVLDSPADNAAIDCYSKAPVDKPTLLGTMRDTFGLRYELRDTLTGVNATGIKPHYYSLNKKAADFGYRPEFSSVEGVIKEAASLLGHLK